MVMQRIGKPTLLVWVASLLGVAGAAVFLFGLATSDSVQVFSGMVAFAAAAIVGVVSFIRARTARRWLALFDAYAERDIARNRDRLKEQIRSAYSRRNAHARTQSQAR